MASLGTLAGGVAHEFGNLLGGIQGCAEDAARETDPAEVRETLGVIERTARRGAAITEKLLRFARPAAAGRDAVDVAAVARDVATPLQLGENFAGVHDMAGALAAGACDYVMPDLARIGGVTGWLRAAALAAAHGIEMSSHLFPEVSAHLLAATPTCHWLEYVDWADAILAEPLALADGHAVVPDRPGAGLAWNEEAVSRFRIC
jgi:mandelate racemase